MESDMVRSAARAGTNAAANERIRILNNDVCREWRVFIIYAQNTRGYLKET